MVETEKMTCPDCGVEMNCHAEKINYTLTLAEPGTVDPDLGGVVEAAHTCPNCGQTIMQRA
jgi:ribosomal protein S27AE